MEWLHEIALNWPYWVGGIICACWYQICVYRISVRDWNIGTNPGRCHFIFRIFSPGYFMWEDGGYREFAELSFWAFFNDMFPLGMWLFTVIFWPLVLSFWVFSWFGGIASQYMPQRKRRYNTS